MKIHKKGTFITFEGPEASGKSSQILLLKKYLKKNRIPHLVTREPGGTKLSENLRKLILNKNNKINNLEEILMLMAARSNHINQVIIPNLDKGRIVISDRFADSTFVYQGFVNNFGINKAQKLHKDLLNNFLPYKTFIFSISVKDILSRLKKRKSKNKYDILNIEFHKKVNLGYKKIYNKKRFIMIDGTKPKQIIHKKILLNLGL